MRPRISLPRWRALVLVGAVGIAVGTGCSASQQGKLVNPIHGQAVPQTVTAQPGEVVPVTLQLQSTRSFDRVAVTATVPPGIVLVSDQDEVVLEPLAAATPRTLSFRFRVKLPGEQSVFLTVRALGLVNEQISQVFAIRFNPAPQVPVPVQRLPDGDRHRVQPVPAR